MIGAVGSRTGRLPQGPPFHCGKVEDTMFENLPVSFQSIFNFRHLGWWLQRGWGTWSVAGTFSVRNMYCQKIPGICLAVWVVPMGLSQASVRRCEHCGQHPRQHERRMEFFDEVGGWNTQTSPEMASEANQPTTLVCISWSHDLLWRARIFYGAEGAGGDSWTCKGMGAKSNVYTGMRQGLQRAAVCGISPQHKQVHFSWAVASCGSESCEQQICRVSGCGTSCQRCAFGDTQLISEEVNLWFFQGNWQWDWPSSLQCLEQIEHAISALSDQTWLESLVSFEEGRWVYSELLGSANGSICICDLPERVIVGVCVVRHLAMLH